MFAIHFTVEPAFLWDPERDEDGYGHGSLYRDGVTVLGDEDKGFRAPLSFWREQDYERQWREGVGRLLAGAETSALVTSMEDPGDEQVLMFWELYRLDGTTVAVQKCLWLSEFGSFWQRRVRRRSGVQPEEIYRLVGSYSAQSDGEPVWEVRLPLSDFADYLSRQG